MLSITAVEEPMDQGLMTLPSLSTEPVLPVATCRPVPREPANPAGMKTLRLTDRFKTLFQLAVDMAGSTGAESVLLLAEVAGGADPRLTGRRAAHGRGVVGGVRRPVSHTPLCRERRAVLDSESGRGVRGADKKTFCFFDHQPDHGQDRGIRRADKPAAGGPDRRVVAYKRTGKAKFDGQIPGCLSSIPQQRI